MPKTTDKPKLILSGGSDNAFSILANARRVARKADWSDERIDAFLNEAESDDYDHLLQTCMKHFDVC